MKNLVKKIFALLLTTLLVCSLNKSIIQAAYSSEVPQDVLMAANYGAEAIKAKMEANQKLGEDKPPELSPYDYPLKVQPFSEDMIESAEDTFYKNLPEEFKGFYVEYDTSGTMRYAYILDGMDEAFNVNHKWTPIPVRHAYISESQIIINSETAAE